MKYKIRDMATNLYQKSVMCSFYNDVQWSKKGSTWKSIEDLSKYFKILEKNRIEISPMWEIIETSAEKEIIKYPAVVFSSIKK